MNVTELAIAQLEPELKECCEYWADRDKAGFCRIEGGIYRSLFLSDTGYFKVNSELIPSSVDNPEQFINWLHLPQAERDSAIELYRELAPGQLLIVFDSDSDSVENRMGKPVVLSF